MNNRRRDPYPVVKISFLLIIGQLILLVLFWQKLPPQLPLFYSRPWGEKQLVQAWRLGILPGLSLIVILINLLTAKIIGGKVRLATQIIIFFTSIFCFLCFYTLLRIIILVI